MLDLRVDNIVGRICEGSENAMGIWHDARERGHPCAGREIHSPVRQAADKAELFGP
ncbi:MAG: hypothetical protein ACRYGP_05235 [Janthinobacterium lividum]